MKSLKYSFLTTLLFMSSAVHAKSISATALTIDDAERKISHIAETMGKEYKITGAHYGNFVHMTATLIPRK
jgi:hypothetical protein